MAGVFQLILPFQLELPFEPRQAASAGHRGLRPRPLTNARGAAPAGEGGSDPLLATRALRQRPSGAAE